MDACPRRSGAAASERADRRVAPHLDLEPCQAVPLLCSALHDANSARASTTTLHQRLATTTTTPACDTCDPCPACLLAPLRSKTPPNLEALPSLPAHLAYTCGHHQHSDPLSLPALHAVPP